MEYIKVSINKHSKLYKTLFFIISISLTLGLIISTCLDKKLINNIYNFFIEYVNNYKNYNISTFIYPIINYFLIFILSLTIIGSFTPFLSLFIENLSIGLLFGVILQKKALKGLIFSLIYFSLTKLLYIVILLYLIINIYKFITKFIFSIKNKSNDSIYSLYSKILIKFLFSLFVITIYNTLLIFVLPKIINIFHFLI